MTLLRRVGLCCLALFAAGCFKPASQRCSSGLVCPENFQCTANGLQCIPVGTVCGNGVTDPGEACDDGNVISGDGCRGDCLGREVCGDGRVDLDEHGVKLEVCDDGNTASGDGCAADCQSEEVCGNFVVDVNEDCDDGRDGGHECNTGCKLKRCGDGNLDRWADGGAEVCDRGDTAWGDGCRGDCRGFEQCGDGLVDTATGEACDSAGDLSGDCNGACRFKRCGDHNQDQWADGGQEGCDLGDPDGGDQANGGLYCSQTCTPKRCGNGVTEHQVFFDGGAYDEECDDGNTSDNDSCNVNCMIPRCGNGYRDFGETCDDGNNIAGDGCRADCLGWELCGDGQKDLLLRDGGHEVCDDGNRDAGDGCRADCQGLELCGDGQLDLLLPDGGREVCDDGNTAPGDGCRGDCQGVERCGDGLLDPTLRDGGVEVCDDGNRDGGDGCRADCRGVETCGDFLIDPALADGGFEVCDDGNNNPGDTCAPDCRTTGVCGNGVIDYIQSTGAFEECDDGNSGDDDDCVNCVRARCGDAKVRANPAAPGDREACDDGAESATCNANCTVRVCGDGITNLTAGEDCDVLNSGGPPDSGSFSQYCNTNCTYSQCGDFIKNALAVPPETCDQGPSSTTSCDSDCSAVTCGDGFLNAAAGELCDVSSDQSFCDGPGAGTQKCTPASCGDGYRNTQAGEFCDDGNLLDNDNCLATCRVAACGDGFVHDAGTGPFEACDDGNTTTEAACAYGTASCSACRNDCGLLLSLTGNVCGDGNLDATHEFCDDYNTVTESQCDYGQGECQACAGNCGGFFALTGPYCGDGVVDGGYTGAPEVCDFSARNGLTACPYGVAHCNLCNATCTVLSLDGGVGPVCGDAHVDPTGDGGVESCDDGNTLTEAACPYGTPSCTRCKNDCSAPLTLTGAYCGDGVVDGGGELCDLGGRNDAGTCPYGTAKCDLCLDHCATFAADAGVGPVCGDRVINNVNGEVCDDGNTTACGGCSADCHASTPSGPATGRVYPQDGNDRSSGDRFTLNDGAGNAITFCIKKSTASTACDSLPGTVVTLTFGNGDGDYTLATALRDAINAQESTDGGADTLSITASRGSNGYGYYVQLSNDAPGAGGNQSIARTGTWCTGCVSGMSGGAGADCAVGVGCAQDSDCASGFCDPALHTCATP